MPSSGLVSASAWVVQATAVEAVAASVVTKNEPSSHAP
jgi:hypothetical protein